MRKNKLVTDEFREAYKRTHGHDFPESRCSGQSTAEALMTIATAMKNPGKPVYMTPSHHGYMNHLVMKTLDRLALEHFDLDPKARSLTYNIFTE